MRTSLWLGIALALTSVTIGFEHASRAENLATVSPVTPSNPLDAFFGNKIGGDFNLVDQNGQRRSLVDFAGRRVLLFFGYANCESICSTAIPLMADAIEALPQDHAPIDLVMITVDPARDTPEGLRKGLSKYGAPQLIGLTGPQTDLQKVWTAYRIEPHEVARDWNDQPIYAHSGFVYLLGSDGKVQSLLPPVLTPKQMAAIIEKHL